MMSVDRRLWFPRYRRAANLKLSCEYVPANLRPTVVVPSLTSRTPVELL